VRRLIWKELREQRFVPVTYGAITMVVIVAWYMAAMWIGNQHHDARAILTAEDTTLGLVVLLCCAGVVSGSGTVSPELGRGTMSFLSILPGGRQRAWFAKVAVGLVIVLLSIVSILACYALITFVLFGGSEVASVTGEFRQLSQHDELAALIIGCSVFSYAACLFVSTLVDRSIVAATL